MIPAWPALVIGSHQLGPGVDEVQARDVWFVTIKSACTTSGRGSGYFHLRDSSEKDQD